MKKTKLFITIFAAFFLLASCESTKQPAESADSYSPETPETPEKNNKKNQKDKKKKEKKNNGFSLFDPSSKYVFGDISTSFQFSPALPLKQIELEATYNIKKDECGFGSPYLAAYYMVFYDDANYNILKSDYEQYLKDFNNKKLQRNKKTYKQYGKIDVTLNWGTIKKSTPNYGKSYCFVGYSFYKEHPYFTLTMFPSFNEYSNYAESASKESIMLTYYFTKSQMEQLLNNTNRQNLVTTVQEQIIPLEDSDNYTEEESQETESSETKTQEIVSQETESQKTEISEEPKEVVTEE